MTGLAPDFLVPSDTLAELSPPRDGGAVVLGSAPDGSPVLLTALRERPTGLVVIGGLHVGRQLALRAMATGAWILVVTPRPVIWRPLLDAAGPGPDGKPAPVFQIHAPGPLVVPRGSEEAPLLVVHDGGRAPHDAVVPRAPWQCSVTLLPALTPAVGRMIRVADLTLLQRLPPGQAQLAGRIWRLTARQTEQLAALPDDQAMALGPDRPTLVQLITTPTEREILGPVRREA